MKRILTMLMILTASVSFLAVTAADVEAKRLGGGKSVGMKREVSPPPAAPKAPTAQPQQGASSGAVAALPVAPKPSGFSRWLGPLAAFGAGAALMSMFGGGAVMGAIGNMLMIVVIIGVVLFAINMFRRKASSGQTMQYAGMSSAEPAGTFAGGSAAGATNSAGAQRYPDGFDADSFLRQAKVSFIRLQAANDSKDLRDIRDYTTPELYAELAMQIQERGDVSQKTDVASLNAELLSVDIEEDQAVSSVRFTGVIHEDQTGGSSLDETWYVVKDLKNPKSTWLIAGIRQNA